VNKIPISAAIEGRGAQEMVALVLRRRIGPIRASHPHNRRKQEMDMLTSTKSGVPETDRNASVSAADVIGRVVQHDQTWAKSEPTTKAGMASCIGSDMSIVGNIECKGPAQVFGRIEGEVRASDLQINDGAQVEGSVIAQNVTVCGRVKGTIRAVRVKLQNGGAVEGDIFHRTLSIDENSQFEGSSRRVENPTEPSSSVDAKGPQKGPQKKDMAPAPLPSIDGELTGGPKH
jgi:cytoskeletal protein CcmA (bactofilin family)